MTTMLASSQPANDDRHVAVAPRIGAADGVTVPRLLLAGIGTFAGHQQRHGALPALSGRAIRAMIAESGLTGRGGAGFPTYRKWDAVASGRRAIVIANAAEGEPASRKDRALLAHAPHLVLDGLQLAARAVGADEAHVYVPAGAADAMRTALAARHDAIRVTVDIAPGTFIAGEESAVVSAISGDRPVPRDKAVRVVERGLAGRPTLVQNVETLAQVALIARYGAPWYRDAGTPDEPGTFLASLSGSVHRPGVYEMPYGVRVGELLEAAGGPTEPLQALLVGGYHGAWIPARPEIAISRAGLAPYDATPGAGVVMALPARQCGLAASARIVEYLAGERANQCGPCVNGLPSLAGTLTALSNGRSYPTVVAEFERLSRLVVGRGACRHPDGTVRFIRSSLRTFATEVNAHLAGWCTASDAADRRSTR